MNHYLQTPIDGDDSSWRQRCNERVETMKAARFASTQDNSPSQSTPFGEEFFGEKKLMAFQLYEVVQNGNPDSFVDALDHVSAGKKLGLADIFDQVTHAGDSLLHVAAHFGSYEIAELVVCHFPEILTKRNIKGNTALHVAAMAKNADVVRVILSRCDGELTRLRNEYGNTALHEAVCSNHLDGVVQLFDADRCVAHYLNKLGKSPLYLAVLTSNMAIVDLLLQAPFPDNIVPRHLGNSPLHAAIFKCNSAILKEILKKRPEMIYLKDEDGGTALHYAVSIGYLEGVRTLLNECPPISTEWNTEGLLPIHLACELGQVEAVKLLLQPEWPNARDLLNQKGQNILHSAAKNGRDEVVKHLLRNTKLEHLNINEKDTNGDTPLHLASKNFHPRVLFYLARDKRIKVNLLNNEGFTARDIVFLQAQKPMTFGEFISYEILYYASVPRSGKASSMWCRRKIPPRIDWIKDRINTLMLVAILIVTVTFAAGFTVPGSVYSSDDPNPQKRGMAVLVNQAIFKVFIVCNTIAMYSSTVGSFILLWAQLGDFHLAYHTFKFALHMVGLALVTMCVAFMTAVRLVVSHVPRLANGITIIGIIFVSMILVTYILLLFPLGVRQQKLRKVFNHLIKLFTPFSTSREGQGRVQGRAI